MKRLALVSALSDKAQNAHLVVVDSLQLPEAKTKKVIGILEKLGLDDKKCLILDEGANSNLMLSVRNVSRIKYSRAPLVNTYDVVNADVLLVTKAGLEKVEEVFAS